jgi:hypothetical protein
MGAGAISPGVKLPALEADLTAICEPFVWKIGILDV